MASEDQVTAAVPSIVEQPTLSRSTSDMEDPTSSANSSSSESDGDKNRMPRPKLGSRKSSGTIIVPRDSPQIELAEEDYDEGDARTMSPRRSSEEIERLGQDARAALIEQAKLLQASLLEICERVETVRTEHEKLEGGNRFLQSYIGELMQTSKITAAGASKGKGKTRT